MADDKLKSFKAGDLQKVTAGGRSKPSPDQPAAAGAAAETTTLGFARIESILDNEDPKAVRAELAKIVEDLKALAAASKAPKDRNAAQKAVIGVERAIELLEYLFQTKEALMQAGDDKG